MREPPTLLPGENLPRPMVSSRHEDKPVELRCPDQEIHEAAELQDTWLLVTLASEFGL